LSEEGEHADKINEDDNISDTVDATIPFLFKVKKLPFENFIKLISFRLNHGY